jgi:hypothetical protein
MLNPKKRKGEKSEREHCGEQVLCLVSRVLLAFATSPIFIVLSVSFLVHMAASRVCRIKVPKVLSVSSIFGKHFIYIRRRCSRI